MNCKSMHWGNEQDLAFKKIKELLVLKRCLVYYDVNKPVRMEVDVSRSAIGAVFTFTRWNATCICFKVTHTNSRKTCNY